MSEIDEVDNQPLSEVLINDQISKGKSGVDDHSVKKYLHPYEVKEHIQKLWLQEKEFLETLFGRVLSTTEGYKTESTGSQMFFLQALLVNITINLKRFHQIDLDPKVEEELVELIRVSCMPIQQCLQKFLQSIMSSEMQFLERVLKL
jgi:hypothetical protein